MLTFCISVFKEGDAVILQVTRPAYVGSRSLDDDEGGWLESKFRLVSCRGEKGKWQPGVWHKTKEEGADQKYHLHLQFHFQRRLIVQSPINTARPFT